MTLSDHYPYHRTEFCDAEVYRPERPEWFAQAECKKHPEVNFFPKRGESVTPAKLICSGCPVRLECLEYGVREHWGIYGGLTEYERRTQRRLRNRLKRDAT